MFAFVKAFIVLLMLSIPSNSLLQAFMPNPPVEKQLAYINQYKNLAIEEMQWSGFPASVKLAQALLESRYGTSYLARKANNHFGIKCKIDWTGETTYADDDAPSECFRKYPSVYDSYKDHTQFVKYNRLHFYDHLFEIPVADYKAWCYGLKKAGYATDPNYAHDLIYYIEHYQLYEFDKQYKNYTPITTSSAPVKAMQKQSPKTVSNKIAAIHIVLGNENLKTIAKKYNIPLNKLVQYNGYTANQPLSEGIEIYLNQAAPQ